MDTRFLFGTVIYGVGVLVGRFARPQRLRSSQRAVQILDQGLADDLTFVQDVADAITRAMKRKYAAGVGEPPTFGKHWYEDFR